MISHISLDSHKTTYGVRALTILYCLINFAAVVLILFNKSLMGDIQGASYSSDFSILTSFVMLFVAIGAVYLSSIFSLKLPVCRHEYRYESPLISAAIGVYLSIFILYVNVTGAFIATSDVRRGDVFSALFAILSPDALFLVYFASRRNRSWLDPVLTVWIISSLQRGWFSFIFPLAVLKIFEIIRSHQIKLTHILTFLALLAIYPFFDIVKVYVRVSENVNLIDMYENVVNVSQSLKIDYLNTIFIAVEKVVGRLQLVSHIPFIYDNKAYFDSLLSSGQIVPFWMEGPYGVALDRMLGVSHAMEVPQALAGLIDPFLNSSWNVNPSIIGWMIIYSDYLAFVIIFIFTLSVSFVWIGKSISNDPIFLGFVYFLLLTLLIPGWIAQLLTFMNTLIFYRLISTFCRFTRNTIGAAITGQPRKTH